MSDLRNLFHRAEPHGKRLVHGGLWLEIRHLQRHQVDGGQRIVEVDAVHQLAHIGFIGRIGVVEHGEMAGSSSGLALVGVVPCAKGNNGGAVSGNVGYMVDDGLRGIRLRALQIVGQRLRGDHSGF